jgi:hypothetical protein
MAHLKWVHFAWPVQNMHICALHKLQHNLQAAGCSTSCLTQSHGKHKSFVKTGGTPAALRLPQDATAERRNFVSHAE